MKGYLFVCFLLACAARLDAQKPTLPEAGHKFIVISHRADHVEVPENTIAAIKHGIKAGVDYVELDLRTTKDSVLVIMHDATVDRMTNGKGKVSDLTYAELRRLKVMDKSKDTGKTYDIPNFEEVLRTCKDKVHIYLDFKDASVDQTYAMIRQYGMENQVIVYINKPSQYTDWRKLVPSMPVMLSLPGDVKTEAGLNTFLAKYPLDLLDGDYSDYAPEVLQAAAKAGIPAWPDIQSPSEAANWDKAIEMGFRGLQTDHPEALIAYLEKKGLR
jgi:glycerophosphoryl diester phosphodiesterase